MPTAYLGLGSNKGERINYIEKAYAEIGSMQGVKIIKTSSVYETEPWGVKEQGDYLNSVMEIETELEAEELLIALKEIEKKIGRTINSKWSEREIDIDLLFYGNNIIKNDFMNIPHPEIENRNFVLIPMKEIAAEFIHPFLNKSISEMMNKTTDKLSVKVFNPGI